MFGFLVLVLTPPPEQYRGRLFLSPGERNHGHA